MSTETSTDVKVKLKLPSRYNVIMHNDDTTVMDFVVFILMDIFKHDEKAAQKLMMKIHNEDSAVVGNYTKEMAETKIEMTTTYAKGAGFPNFKVTMEEE